MWPLLRPGRGSGAVPSKRSAGRASTISADPSPSPAHVLDAGDEAVVEPRREHRVLRMSVAIFDRAALVQPFGQAAVQNFYVARRRRRAMSTRREPRRRGHACHRRRSACRRPDQAPSSPGEGIRVRQHVGQAARGVRDQVDIEEHGAGDMLFAEFRRRRCGPSGGRCQEASMMPRPGSRDVRPSHSVETKFSCGMKRSCGLRRNESACGYSRSMRAQPFRPSRSCGR